MTKNQKKVNRLNCEELDSDTEKLLWKRDFKSAENKARSKIKSDGSSKNYYTLALTLFASGFFKNNVKKIRQAKKYYKKIILEFPNTLHSYLAQARLKEENKKLRESLPSYFKAFKKCQTARNAVHIGNVYYQLGKRQLAKKYYLIAERLKKGSAKHHLESIKKEARQNP